MGRKPRSRNKGYFFRTGRGWYTKIEGQFVPLETATGQRLRDKGTPDRVVKEAYHRVIVHGNSPKTEEATVLEVVQAYIASVEVSGAASTLSSRADALYDFCFGFPARFRTSTSPDSRRRIDQGDVSPVATSVGSPAGCTATASGGGVGAEVPGRVSGFGVQPASSSPVTTRAAMRTRGAALMGRP